MRRTTTASGALTLAGLLAACGCATKAPVGGGGGSGSGVASCDGVAAHVTELYTADAKVAEPTRVEAAAADNTAMALSACRAAPERVAPCLAAARDVATLERTCLPALDDEGSEGDVFLGK